MYTTKHMPHWFQGIIILSIVWIAARAIKRNSNLLKNLFIPSSIIGGTLLLIVGPQISGIVPKEIIQPLSVLPAMLINIVFASLFLGKSTPGLQQVWERAGPMIALGNTIAWGMYAIGILLVLTILGPLFNAPPIFGALLEISFTGGHGTAAGLSPTFTELGWPQATDMALGIATFSIIAIIVCSLVIINVYNRRKGRIIDRNGMLAQQRRMARNGYDLTRVSRDFEKNPLELLLALLPIVAAVAMGWIIWQALIQIENTLLGSSVGWRIFAHLPLFTLAMFGGLIIQSILIKIGRSNFINPKTTNTISTIALDLLIITAVGTMSLNTISSNLPTFLILSFAGVAWALLSFFVLAPRFFREHWFEHGLTDLGQAMGMTATGLLVNRLVDPLNRTGARESFAYKQLVFEPFMGGGIITAFAVIAIVEFGSLTVLSLATAATVFWIVVGLSLGKKRRSNRRRSSLIGLFALRH